MTADQVELRGMCDREAIDVLDAVSTARRISRMELVNSILAEWAVQQIHVATIVYRVTRGKGHDADGDRR